jgi:hypothetical protein
MTTNRITLPPELAAEARALLDFSRSQTVRAIAAEVGAQLPIIVIAAACAIELEELPEWMALAFNDAAQVGALASASLRFHLSARTAFEMGDSLLTGFSPALASAFEEGGPAISPAVLAGALGVDLYEFAAEWWKDFGIDTPNAEGAT